MKRHHLFLLIFLTVASISASATCLYDGGKGGTTPPAPKTTPTTTRDIETVPIIIFVDDDDNIVPIVPHHYFAHLNVEVKTDIFTKKIEFIYGFGLGNGKIVVANKRAGEMYNGTVTPNTDRYIIYPNIFEGDWVIGILVQDEQGKNVEYYGDFIYKGKSFRSF